MVDGSDAFCQLPCPDIGIGACGIAIDRSGTGSRNEPKRRGLCIGQGNGRGFDSAFIETNRAKNECEE